MRECDNCGERVTKDFHRVFSDNDGNLLGCRNCSQKSGTIEDIKERMGIDTV